MKVKYYDIVIYDVKLYMYFVNVIWLKICFQKKIKNGNHAYPNLVEDLQRRPVPQGSPVLLNVPQDTQRGFQGNRAHFYHKTHGTPTGFPHGMSVSKGRQEFLIPQETYGKALSIPLSTVTQAVSGHQDGIITHDIMSEEISTFPQGIQGKIISFPQGSHEKISRVPVLTTVENDEDVIVTREGKRNTVDFPKGTTGLEETEDDIIIVHQGTPEDLISFVQETLQEIMGVPQGNSIPQGTAEEVMDTPNQITVYDETGKEITGFSKRTVEEIMGITQEITIPQGSVEEIMGIPKGITIPQETLHEIMAIMATVPDQTLHEIMGFPQGVAVPHGINIPMGPQGQASAVQDQNRYEGNIGVDCQEQQSFCKPSSEMAPNTDVSAQHQLTPSYYQSVSLIYDVNEILKIYVLDCYKYSSLYNHTNQHNDPCSFRCKPCPYKLFLCPYMDIVK